MLCCRRVTATHNFDCFDVIVLYDKYDQLETFIYVYTGW